MGDIEGSYRVIQTPGTRLGSQFNAGISTLEPGHSFNPKAYGKGLHVRVQGLDDTQDYYDLETKADGQTLLSDVFRRFNLMESDYFGLEFQNLQMDWVWLEPLKPVMKQARRPKNTLFRLSVKFFPPDPGQLQEEFTRYLFALQIKRDLMEGRLTCSDSTAALLASHLVQSEIGDYDDVADREFLKLNKLLPNQERLQEKVMELHRRHLGQTPAESDFQVLEIARKLEMYGVRFHPAADREGTKINLSVAHMGLQVFQGNTKINTFNWSKIRKLSFKRKRFLVKLHPEVHGPHQDTLEFLMASRDQCKEFWKNCVEHHTFFRLFDQPKPKSKAILFSRGSSFRYSGRTQKQLVEYVKDSGMRRTPYQRRNSKIRESTRSLATEMPKQSLSFSESLREPSSPSSATVSFHSLHASSSPPRQPARAPSPLKEEAAPAPHCSFPGARGNREAGEPSPMFVCVESSTLSLTPSLCGIDDGQRERVPGAVEFRAEPAVNSPLQLIEEYIDDDPGDISFFGGMTDAYDLGFKGTDSTRAYQRDYEDEDDHGMCAEPPTRSETSSLLNNQSQGSSLERLPLRMDDSFSLGLGGSDVPSEASSMVNFPPCSVRSETSSAAQFGDLVEQLEQLSCPPTATEGSSAASSDCDSDWGYDAALTPQHNLFFSGEPGPDGFLLECHNLQAMGFGDMKL